ncbi:hypothetical protein JCM14469_24230 [Desulfatiferula olefinivorans]
MVLIILTSSSSVFGQTQYFNGKIERIEVCKSNGGSVTLFFDVANGTAPAVTNGCSNDVAFPYVRVNHDKGIISDFDRTIVSTALSAQMADRSLRVRYDDQSMIVESLAVD